MVRTFGEGKLGDRGSRGDRSRRVERGARWAGRGGWPYRTWLIPGELGDRASQEFVGQEETPYQVLYRPWVTNSTLQSFAVYINHRTDSYWTFFSYREGPRDFSILPDA